MAEHERIITIHTDGSGGFIEVNLDGDRVRLFIDDGQGNAATVWLGWTTSAELVLAIGATVPQL